MSEMKQTLETPEAAQLKAERVQLLLLELPGWRLGAGGRTLVRSRCFKSVGEAADFVGLVGKLAALQRQPVSVALSGRSVSLTLTGHPAKGCTGGLTNPVLRLAAMLG